MDEGLTKIRHERSKKDFPFLKLENDEYVEYAFSRARVCLAMIFGGVAVGVIVILLAFLLVLLGQNSLDDMGRNFMYVLLAALVIVALMIGIVALVVYRGNRLFITNKHVIQLVMKSPVATSINMIDLQSIEDASFHQNGILQKMFHYGTFRLSTVGDETTYTFDYSDISPTELREVAQLITDAKKKTKDSSKED
ncbi:PH domain-containing protein [Candidatus Saccharibacteria bacterium]|nr:PH domain-containing protein [Candidatus Saccharibacteria bacterium]